jgi:hypothetical protein
MIALPFVAAPALAAFLLLLPESWILTPAFCLLPFASRPALKNARGQKDAGLG